MAETSVCTRAALISQLTRCIHGDLGQYVTGRVEPAGARGGQATTYRPVAPLAAQTDPEFFAHLCAWNDAHGEIRDSRVALPVISLAHAPDAEVAENALALVAGLVPRLFLQAVEFMRTCRPAAAVVRRAHLAKRLVRRYIRELEAQPEAWERAAVQHRRVMETLYRRYHVVPAGGPGGRADVALLKGHATDGKLGAVRLLSTAPAGDLARLVTENRIGYLVARGALGRRVSDPLAVDALLRAMTPTELVTNLKAIDGLLEPFDDATKQGLRETVEHLLGRTGGQRMRGAALKATTAAEALQASAPTLATPVIAEKLREVQQKQVDALGKVEGRWAVLGDRSGSMQETIDLAREVAGLLAAACGSDVHLVFFDTAPTYYDATGKGYAEIREATKRVIPGGATSVGCALDYLLERGKEVDGIAIVSDGDENRHPLFAATYLRYCERTGLNPTVYFYLTRPGREDGGTLVDSCRAAGIDVQVIDLREHADRYSLAGLVKTMRAGRYALADEVMATPLRTLDAVLPRTAGTYVMRWSAR